MENKKILLAPELENKNIKWESNEFLEEWNPETSLAEQYQLQVAIKTTGEDLDISKVINLLGQTNLEVFSIHSMEREYKVFENPVEEILTGETRLNKLKEILNLEHLSQTEREQVLRLLRKHADRFQLEGDGLSTTNVTKHRIITIDDHPVNHKQYRLPHSLREEADKQVSELLEKGIIKSSKSPYNTSLWVVPKKPDQTGKLRWRVVLDFRPLNEKTIPMAYPLPNITAIFDQVGKACYYTVIDCVSGFH